jgi:CubicO group peptidase (beta-lactamase class C family)
MPGRLAAYAVLIGILLGATPVAGARPEPLADGVRERVDRYVESEKQRQQIPSVALAIVVGSEPVWVRGYGYADVSTGSQ